MYVDVYFSGPLPVDRDEVEDAFADVEGFDVVGAGTGDTGANIDLEVDENVSREDALRTVARVLEDLDLIELSSLRVSDTGERIAAVELPR